MFTRLYHNQSSLSIGVRRQADLGNFGKFWQQPGWSLQPDHRERLKQSENDTRKQPRDNNPAEIIPEQIPTPLLLTSWKALMCNANKAALYKNCIIFIGNHAPGNTDNGKKQPARLPSFCRCTPRPALSRHPQPIPPAIPHRWRCRNPAEIPPPEATTETRSDNNRLNRWQWELIPLITGSGNKPENITKLFW